MPRSSSQPIFTPIQHWLVLGMAMLSLAPFILHVKYFQKLYWFGDSWGLLNQLTHQGLWRWLFFPFAENFVPVFKMLWLGCIYLLNGSYFWLIVCLWLTHALIVYLYGRLLKSWDFPFPGILLAMLLLGLAWTNIET